MTIYISTEIGFKVQVGGQNEEPAIFEKDVTYYMITSGLSGWNPNAVWSFKAASIIGYWEASGNPKRGADADKTFQ